MAAREAEFRLLAESSSQMIQRLDFSERAVLREFGNMSSVTIMAVLARLMREGAAGRRGVALGFGPGVGVESLVFRGAG